MVKAKTTLGVVLVATLLSGTLNASCDWKPPCFHLYWQSRAALGTNRCSCFLSEAGEKYALRLADFVHKRLKNERTASVSLMCILMCMTTAMTFFVLFLFTVHDLAARVCICAIWGGFLLNHVLLADMDQYPAEDHTHITPYCWFPESKFFSITEKAVLKPWIAVSSFETYQLILLFECEMCVTGDWYQFFAHE